MNADRKRLVVVGAAALAVAALAVSVSAASSQDAEVRRGEYLVKGMGCGDCHTPVKMGPSGPEPDMARMLAGHPQSLVMPPAPKLPAGPWLVSAAATFTAWAGPWGVSFTANLTPDPKTGLGDWTAQTFVDTVRSGRLMAKGRKILPPMPIPAFQNLTDADLRAIFAYLHTIPAVANRVPEPVPPADGDDR
jgi:mono/diheme cytochrome c family protein